MPSTMPSRRDKAADLQHLEGLLAEACGIADRHSLDLAAIRIEEAAELVRQPTLLGSGACAISSFGSSM